MKNLITTLSFIFVATICSAQNVKKRVQIKDLTPEMYKANVIVENNYLNKFIGKWTWSQGAEKFDIEFIKVEGSIPVEKGSFVLQQLSGTYKYYLENSEINLDSKWYFFLGIALSGTDPVLFKFRNKKNMGNTILELKYVNSNTLKLQLKKYNIPEKSFPLPTDITLKRIK